MPAYGAFKVIQECPEGSGFCFEARKRKRD